MWPGLVGWECLRSDVRSVRAQSVRRRTSRAHRAHLWARGEAFCVETPARLDGSERTGLRGGKRFCGDVCAPPVSVPVMADQVRRPSAVWMERTAPAPSPTAEATRFTEVSRTAPAANHVGMLVSNG